MNKILIFSCALSIASASLIYALPYWSDDIFKCEKNLINEVKPHLAFVKRQTGLMLKEIEQTKLEIEQIERQLKRDMFVVWGLAACTGICLVYSIVKGNRTVDPK